MSASDYSDLVVLIQTMETKLTNALNSGLQGLSTSITNLSDAHHRALLEQERRNSLFADRERVETIAEHVHENAGTIMSMTERIARISAITDQLLTAESKFYQSAAGYMIVITLAIAGPVLAFLLSHAHL